MLTDIPFEYHPDITDNFVDALYSAPGNTLEDVEFNLASKFGWIKAAHHDRITNGNAGFDSVVKVMEMIKQNITIRKIFSEMATSARNEEDPLAAALIVQNLIELGGSLLKYVDEHGATNESLITFAMINY